MLKIKFYLSCNPNLKNKYSGDPPISQLPSHFHSDPCILNKTFDSFALYNRLHRSETVLNGLTLVIKIFRTKTALNLIRTIIIIETKIYL